MPKSSVFDTMPTETRAWLEQELRKRNYGDLTALTALLAEKGIELSRSSIGNFSKSLKDREVRMREAQHWTQRIMDAQGDDMLKTSMSANALLQQKIIEVMLEHDFVIPKNNPNAVNALLLKMGKMQSELGKSLAVTDKRQIDRETELKQRAEEAAEDVGKTLKASGLSDDVVGNVKQKILGVIV